MKEGRTFKIMKLGIDFGTFYSSAALLIDGVLRPIKEPSNSQMLCFPSSVCLTKKGEILIGLAAENARKANSNGYKNIFKRDLGQTHPYFLGEQGREFLPEDLVTEILSGLKREAEKTTNSTLDSAVITVPATYLSNKKELMRQSAIKAGFREIIFLEEPVAAAIYYSQTGKIGHQVKDGEIILIYDLGGGTFDAALIQKQGESYQLLGLPVGDPECGGIDFEREIDRDFKQYLAGDPTLELLKSGRNDLAALRAKFNLQDWYREVKHQLSQAEEIEDLPPLPSLELSDPYILSRSKFEEMIRSYLDKTCSLCEQLVQQSRTDWENVDRILLVGGSTRIPYVKNRLEQQFKRPVIYVDDPELAICYGAAIYGNSSIPKIEEKELQFEFEKQRQAEEKARQLNASLIRELFARYLAEVVQTIQVAESEGKKSSELSSSDRINKLKRELSSLERSFYVLVIGYFNKKTSRIESILDRIFSLSAGIYYNICIEVHNLSDSDITAEIMLDFNHKVLHSDAIVFVMTAVQVIESGSKIFYLIDQWNEYDNIKAKIFYLIDKSENLEETEFNEISKRLSQKLWKERLCKVNSLNAEEKLNQAKSRGCMVFIEFEERLDNFLKNEILQCRILQSVEITKQLVNEYDHLISQRLQTMKLEIESLTEFIGKTDEPLTEIENNCSNIKKILDWAIESYKGSVLSTYRDLFRETKTKLDRILTLYSIDNLKKESLNKYLAELQNGYEENVREALNSWQKQSESNLVLSINTANLSIESSVKSYNELVKKIDSRFSIEEFQSILCSDNIILDVRMFVVSVQLQVSSSFFRFRLPFIVPMLLGAELSENQLTDFINPSKRIERLKKKAINKYQEHLEQFTKDEKIEQFKKMIESVAKNAFSPLVEKQQTMLSNAQSIRDSLNNQKIQLENWKINYEEEELRLINLGQKLSMQLHVIVEEYNKYFPSVRDKNS